MRNVRGRVRKSVAVLGESPKAARPRVDNERAADARDGDVAGGARASDDAAGSHRTLGIDGIMDAGGIRKRKDDPSYPTFGCTPCGVIYC